MATQASIDLAQEMYVAYYGRPGDPAGVDFWAEQFDATDNLDEQLDAFGNSQEFLDSFGGLSDDELIDNLFQQMFNRDADPAGKEFYLELLDSGEATLATIAKDIADGAQNQDETTLTNKVDVANDFTDEVEATDAPYSSGDIPTAQALLASVDDTQASVTAAKAQIPGIVDDINGIFTLTDANPVADYSGSSVGVTVSLDGDDSETEFDVTGSAFDDTFILEEYFKADLDGAAGFDTVDFSDADGVYTISLETGTFSADDDGDALPDFSGTLTSIESVIGSDQVDTVNGSDADERFDGGAGVDTLRGGAGDDTFVYENETDLTTEIADGQSGTDVIEFTGQVIDLTTTAPGNVSVENLLLSNADGDTQVTLSLLGQSAAGFGPDDFRVITGSSASDRITVTAGADADFSGTKLVSIDVVSSAVATMTVKSNTLDEVLTLAGPGAAEITAGAAGSYNLSGTTLSGWDTLDGLGGAAAGVIWVLNQTQIDAILDDTTLDLFGTDMADAGSATVENDALQASGSLDLTRITASGGINVYEVDFGTAASIEIDETQLGAGLALIDGTAGSSKLILNESGDDILDLGAAGLGIRELGTLELLGANDIALAIGAGAFRDIASITGTTDDLEINATTEVDLTGSDLSVFETLTFSAAGGTVKLDQGVLDNFDEWGTGLSAVNNLEFILGGTSLNLSAVDFDDTFNDGGNALTVTGSDEADTVTEANGDDEDVGLPVTYDLGKGNDTFKGTDKTFATGAIVVNGEEGDDDITLGEPDTGTYTVSGGDGDDTITGDKGADTLNGNDGDDVLVAGAGADVLNGGADDDDLTAGDGTVSLTGGTGADVFTIAMNELGVAILDFDTGTDEDTLRLNFDFNTTPATAFDTLIVNGRLPVLEINTTTMGLFTGDRNLIRNDAIGDGTGALPTFAGLGTTNATMNSQVIGFLNNLTNFAALDNTKFALFATSGSSLIAYIVTKAGTMTSANTKITVGEVTTVTLVALGNGGVMSEADLILI